MPRITKAEVRASMLKEPKKVLSEKKKEDKSREKKTEENGSVSVKLERAETSNRNTKNPQSSETKNKKDTTSFLTSNKDQNTAPTKTVSVSDFDPTPVVVKPLTIKETIVSKLTSEKEKLLDEIKNLQEEKEKILSEKDVQDNLLAEIKEDTKRIMAEKNKEVQKKDEEIYNLNNQIDNLNNRFDAYVEENESIKNRKINKIAKFIGEVFGTILISAIGAGILGIVVLLVARLLYSVVSWLF